MSSMADRISKERRSWNMSRIKGKDTSPEIRLRSMLHRNGYRFRLHSSKLPGRPDIILPKYRAVVFVHGCFWHRHQNCVYATTPKSNVDFWQDKFMRTIIRDQVKNRELVENGWKVFTVWECELNNSPQETFKKIDFCLQEGTNNGN